MNALDDVAVVPNSLTSFDPMTTEASPYFQSATQSGWNLVMVSLSGTSRRPFVHPSTHPPPSFLIHHTPTREPSANHRIMYPSNFSPRNGMVPHIAQLNPGWGGG